MLIVFYGVDNTKKTTRAKKLVSELEKQGFRARYTKRPHGTPPNDLPPESLYAWMKEDAIKHYMAEVHPYRTNTIVVQDRGILCGEVYNNSDSADYYNKFFPHRLLVSFAAFTTVQMNFCKSLWNLVGKETIFATEILPDLHVLCLAGFFDMSENYKRKGEELSALLMDLSMKRQSHYKKALEEQEHGYVPLIQVKSSQRGVREELFEDVIIRRLVFHITTECEINDTLDNYKKEINADLG